MESSDPSELDPAALDRAISGALDNARRDSRKTVPEMVRSLSSLQPRSAGGTERRQTWHEWQANPGMVSARTLLKAGLLAKAEWALALLQAGEAAYRAPARRGELVGQDQRMARVEEEVASVKDDVARVEEEVATLRGTMAEEFANMTEAIQHALKDAMQGNPAPLSQRVAAAEKRLGKPRRGDRNTG